MIRYVEVLVFAIIAISAIYALATFVKYLWNEFHYLIKGHDDFGY